MIEHVLDKFLSSGPDGMDDAPPDARVALLIGDGGTGKTSASLWLVHEVVERAVQVRKRKGEPLGA
eukprot:gene29801-26777_t